ncbi:MAG: hypothetical protein H6Q90_6232 [Deltaproteobacteria bacterium]|nr:hypothetical protein [Deltaproteobacteria bacterium]
MAHHLRRSCAPSIPDASAFRRHYAGWVSRSVTVGGFVLLVGCGRLAFDPEPVATDGALSQSGFRQLCAFTRVTVIENGLQVDDLVGASLSASLSSRCPVAPITRTVSQGAPGILDPTSGRPLLAVDDLAIIGGGDGPHRAIAYLLRSDTPVTWTGSSIATFRERATGRTIVTGPVSDSHDYALVMVVAEPIGGGRTLSASGMAGNGTRAAGYWFANEVAPTIAANELGWTLVEWTNADGDPGPTVGDTFVVIESGR